MAITFLCTSYIPSFHPSSLSEPSPGQYEIVVKGDTPLLLRGTVNFESQPAITREGMSYTKWNIRLRNHEGGDRHFLDFYLVDALSSNALDKGSYHITENVESFFSEFKGVFGFADIDQLGELPFFSRQGRITIFEVGEKSLTGTLQLELRNASGKKIALEGNFMAVKEFAY